MVCVVKAPLEPSESDDAKRHKVRLIATSGENLDSGDVVCALRDHGIVGVGWWVGHDVVTGHIALSARETMDMGQVALIHHMAYGQYAGHKHGRGATGVSRHGEQRALFAQADRCFAVGPKLRDNADEMLTDEGRPASVMLIPGLAEGIQDRDPAKTSFRAMVFGRMDAEDDRIKQGSLAVAAMAEACRESAAQAGVAPILQKSRPEIEIVGIEEPGSQTERDLVALAEEFAAGHRLQVTARPFLENREALFRDLSSASVALMPSWHEGFGLTGWEAVAAGVPLILSQDSGLYQLLREEAPGVGPGGVSGIPVAGHTPTGPDDPNQHPFLPGDVRQVKNAILSIAADPGEYRKHARELRSLLRNKGMSWEGTANGLLTGLGLNDLPPGGATDRPPPRTPAPPAPVTPAPSPSWLADPRQTLPEERLVLDSLLLRPEYRIVPFQDMLASVADDVLAWAQDEGRARLSVALRLYTADGGSGKTRLMVEVCGRLLDRAGPGWTAAFVPDSRHTPSVIADIEALVKTAPRVFLVVDNAESRRSDVEAIIKAALCAPAGHRVRLVLLGRGDGEWWSRLCEDTADAVARGFLRSPEAAEGPLSLPAPDTGDRTARQRLYREAQDAFRARLSPHRSLPDTPTPMPDLSAPHFRHTLLLHLAALMALLGRNLETGSDLLTVALDREQDYWRSSLSSSGLDHALLPGMKQALALLTLTGGTTTARDAREILLLVPALRDAGDAERRQVFDHLRTLYPREGGIDALRPDLLGERLVERVLADEDELLDCVFDTADRPTWITSALTVLTRIGQRGSSRLLQRALFPSRLSIPLVDRAIEVAVDIGDPLGPALAEAVRQADKKLQQKIINHVWPKRPKRSVALAPFIKEITHLMAAKTKENGWESVRSFVKFICNASDISAAYYSVSEFNLAQEWPEVAFSAIEGTKKAYQSAADSVLPYLYTSHASALAAQGKMREALKAGQRAEALWRDLAAQRPDAHRADWAGSLNNLGNRLADEGRYTEALEATRHAEEIWREMAARRPDAHRADWATSLNNLGTCLANEGRYAEALEAARHAEEIWRDLAAQRPDAHRANWASSLSNLGACLADEGCHAEALKAARHSEEIRRELAAQRPDAHRADWAGSLDNLGIRLADEGSYAEALEAARHAEEIRRELAVQRPDAHRAGWARTSGNRAELILQLGQCAEAEPLARQAADLFAVTLPAQQRRYAPEQGWCLTLQAAALLGMEAEEEAATLAENALLLFDSVGKVRPNDIEPYRAMALAIRGLRPGLPRDEAWGMAQEALRLLVPHARRRGRSVLLSLTYVAKALRVTAPPGAPDPVPADLDSILHAARREAAPAVCGE